MILSVTFQVQRKYLFMCVFIIKFVILVFQENSIQKMSEWTYCHPRDIWKLILELEGKENSSAHLRESELERLKKSK